MWGAIIGDIAGSIYEYEQFKKCHPIQISEIITTNSFYSDDTILTIAILDAIINNQPYEKKLREYARKYKNQLPKNIEYFKGIFSKNFLKWVETDEQGKSTGNGAMMRISPIGYLCSDENDVIENTIKATIPSHNSKEAIANATIVAMIIFLSRKGYSKKEIISYLHLKYQYKPFTKFNTTCNDTIDNCLYALFTTTSFEESIRTIISYGGDTDTNACIVGSMAESLYGINKELITAAKKLIPQEFTDIIENTYPKIKKLQK